MKRSVAMGKATAALRLVTPPIVWRLTRGLRSRGRLEGPLASWDAAAKRATGWNSPAIAEKALAAALKVRDGAAAFERDSRPYDRIVYSPGVLAALLLAAARHRTLNVIDFGGGLGSNYYQHRKLLCALPGPPVSWNVVERAALAKVGAAQFQTPELRFHADLAEVRTDDAVLLFTGSLQYVADAFGLLERAVRDIDIVAIDRLYVSAASDHAAFVQHLDSRRFGLVTLPMWCFAKTALIGWFEARGFALVEQFLISRERPFEFCGMLFMRS
ncbi:MAG: methyltransferase, TIGR04325 family [Xanthobacteraceae bacterium]